MESKLKLGVIILAIAAMVASFLVQFELHILAHYNNDSILVTTNSVGEGALELFLFAVSLPCVLYSSWHFISSTMMEYRSGRL